MLFNKWPWEVRATDRHGFATTELLVDQTWLEKSGRMNDQHCLTLTNQCLGGHCDGAAGVVALHVEARRWWLDLQTERSPPRQVVRWEISSMYNSRNRWEHASTTAACSLVLPSHKCQATKARLSVTKNTTLVVALAKLSVARAPKMNQPND